jgi:hypothetical protein
MKGNDSGLNLKYYPRIRLEGLRKSAKNGRRDSQHANRDLSTVSPAYEAESLSTTPRSSVKWLPFLQEWHLFAHSDAGNKVVYLGTDYLALAPVSILIISARKVSLWNFLRTQKGQESVQYKIGYQQYSQTFSKVSKYAAIFQSYQSLV